jgi:hypothetical protein
MGGMGGIGGLLSIPFDIMGANTKAEAARQQAEAQAKGDTFEAENQRDQWFQGMQKAWQTDTAMTQHLGSTLATINAIRGSSGADITSPSGEAIENRTLALGNQDIARTTTNIMEQAESHKKASLYYLQAAQDAIDAGGIAAQGAELGGLGGAIGGLGGFAGGLFKGGG